MTLQELYDRAVQIATSGLTDPQRMLIGAEVVVEDLALEVFGQLSSELASNPATRTMLRRTVPIVFSGATAPLPQYVLSDYLCESDLYDPADLTARYSYQQFWEMFVRDYETRYGAFFVSESTVTFHPPGQTYPDFLASLGGGGGSTTLNLITPCSLEIPATVTTAVTGRDEVLELAVTRLASAIRKGVAGVGRS